MGFLPRRRRHAYLAMRLPRRPSRELSQGDDEVRQPARPLSTMRCMARTVKTGPVAATITAPAGIRPVVSLKRRLDEWQRREMQRVRWAQTSDEGRRRSRGGWSAHAAHSATVRLAPLLVVLLGFLAGIPKPALIGIAVVVVLAAVVWSLRDESQRRKQHEAEFEEWLKREGTE